MTGVYLNRALLSRHPLAYGLLGVMSVVNLELLMLWPWDYAYFPMAKYLPGYPTPRYFPPSHMVHHLFLLHYMCLFSLSRAATPGEGRNRRIGWEPRVPWEGLALMRCYVTSCVLVCRLMRWCAGPTLILNFPALIIRESSSFLPPPMHSLGGGKTKRCPLICACVISMPL